MSVTSVQALAKDCLAANAAFAGVAIFLELDENASPEQLRAFEESFERELATKGIAVVIVSPELATLDQVEGSAINTHLAVPVVICENPAVNRAQPDAEAVPPRTPLNRSSRRLLEAAISALLPHFKFPPQPAGRPQWAEGFWAYYLVALRKHAIRAQSPA